MDEGLRGLGVKPGTLPGISKLVNQNGAQNGVKWKLFEACNHEEYCTSCGEYCVNSPYIYIIHDEFKNRYCCIACRAEKKAQSVSDSVDTLVDQVKKLKDKLDEVYYAPGMPGYLKHEQRLFEELNAVSKQT